MPNKNLHAMYMYVRITNNQDEVPLSLFINGVKTLMVFETEAEAYKMESTVQEALYKSKVKGKLLKFTNRHCVKDIE